jgi:streptogramin lyase
MRLIDRTFVLAVLGLLLSPSLVRAGVDEHTHHAQSPSAPQPASASDSLTGQALLSPSLEQLVGGEGALAARAARRESPEAYVARSASRVKFENLRPQSVRSLAASSFPQLLTPAGGGVPELAPGQRVVSYPTDHSAEVSTPAGKRLIESIAPLAASAPHGHRVPFDLRLTQAGSTFRPARSQADVSVPRDLSRGVSLTSAGVSLTPITRAGAPLSSSAGTLEGASVIWNANSASGEGKLATIAKASLDGFDLTSMLLSQASPNQLYFRVGMSAGARLRPESDGSVRIVKGHETIAAVSPVSAEDAEGTSVPVSLSVSGNVISVHVQTSGDYLYPIAVDPEINDSQLAKTTAGKRSGWEFHTSSGHFSSSETYGGPGSERLETVASGGYGPSEYGFWGYQTKGASHIYELKTETSAHNNGAKVESFLEFEEPSGAQETKKILSTPFENSEYEHKATTICAANGSKAEECLPGSGKANNAVHFQQSTTGSSGTGFSDSMTQGVVSIAEPSGTHSATSYNTTSPTLEFETEVEGKKVKVTRANVLYGSGSWLTVSAGALAMNSSDPGIGVAATKLEYESSAGHWTGLFEHNYLGVENACQGVQCYVSHSEDATLPLGLPDGEDTLRYKAEEAISGTQSLETEGKAKVKVDTTKPHALRIEGLPYGNELSERPYELTAEATDGEGSTIPSSGIKSIALRVDGHEVGTPTGSCTVAKGQCTATRKATVNGAELGAGKHDIEIVALDSAGNEAHAYQPITIRHSTPVALGPGSLDLQSGDFALSAGDVSLGSGLTVARNSSSRAPEAGDEGPLGPQWSLNGGNAQSLAEVIDGAVMLTDANGHQVLFASLGGGHFESPNGDSNLVLTVEENKTTKEKLAYYLENPSAHTKTRFTLPSGAGKLWVPSKTEGAVGTDTMSYGYQTAPQVTEYTTPQTPNYIAAGPDGNLWYSTTGEGTYGKITPAGVVQKTSLNGARSPQDIITGSEGNLLFDSYYSLNKLATSGKITERWTYIKAPGVITQGPEGKIFFTVPATGEIGTPNEQPEGTNVFKLAPPAEGGTYSDLTALTVGPDGNLWIADSGNGKYGAIWRTSKGGGEQRKYMLPSSGELNSIMTGPDGNLWATYFSSAGTSKIEKITTSGVITEYSLPNGSDPRSITLGPDHNLWFAEPGTKKIATITTSGVVTEHALALASESEPWNIVAGSDGKIWFTEYGKPVIGTVTIAGTSTEPTETLAPAQPGVSCTSEMKPGCRALKYTYATSTSATGEGPSAWGEYKGRLAKVSLEAFNPSSKTMQQTAVAQYSYDSRGELRAEWDPRISPALKTTYGYDEAGRVTAMTPPGQQPWIFTYGAANNDKSVGRLVKSMRPTANTAPWNGEAVQGTEAPRISGAPVTFKYLSVSHGNWSGSPLAYGYQWERCAAVREACTPIPGATGATYHVQSADYHHALGAVVTATNAGGSATQWAYTTREVETETEASGKYELTEYALACCGAEPFAITQGPDNNLWFTERGYSKVGKITMTGALTLYSLAGLETETSPEGITSGPDGNLWLVENAARDVSHITTSGTLTTFKLTRTNTSNVAIAAGSDGNLWFTESGTSYIGRITPKDEVVGEYALPSGSEPYGIAANESNLWFTEYGKSKIGKITTAGVITEYALPAGSYPYAIAKGAEGNLWFTDYGTSKIGKITTAGAITEYALPAGSHPRGIAKGAEGNLWVAESGTNKLASVTTSGAISEYALPSGSTPYGITAGPNGSIWFTDYSTNKIGEWILLNVREEGEHTTPEPGTTIHYGVPVSGSGAPHPMSSTEVAKWGQSDDPVEATSITPPDEPVSSEVTINKRATTYYLDAQGRQVNIAGPSSAANGSISTTEYNEFNDPIRSLSPDNRQTALEAGAASVEKSKLLDTQNTYNGEGAKEGEVAEPGTRLIESVGPQHKVTYLAGHEQKESLARLHSKFFYNEGAPGGETYELQTKKTTLAQLSNEEEVEVRTTKTSYSGQSNLGWKLRAPTSVATYGPEEATLSKSATEYNPTTGQVTETRGTSAETTLSYAKKFGEAGTEAGKLKAPWGDVVNAEGAILVVDLANNRIEKFSSEGVYVSSFGTAGSGNGQLKEPQGIALDSSGNVYVADTGNNRIEEFSSTGTFVKNIGSLGTESGKLKAPSDLAFDPKGNLWVADTANSRVEKFSKEGVYVSEFGSLGIEPGKLKEPKGIAIDAGEHVWVADTANNRIEEFSPTGALLRRFGTPGPGEGQLNTPIDLRIDASGNLWTADSKNNRAESFSPSGTFVTQIGSAGTANGQLAEPKGIAFDAAGKAWVSDSNNNRLQQWSKGANAHDQKTIYYSTAANSEYPACGGHAEYAGLTCETLPAKQPELVGLPALPITTYAAYNIYNEPETTTEAFGSQTRTKKETYDALGRRASSETTATSGKSLPKVTFSYNAEQGTLEKESGEERTLSSEFNKLGELVKYTDSDGNTAKYTYAGPENDYLVTEASDSSDSGTSRQSYAYDPTTKLRTKLIDSAAGSFTAAYDIEGKLTSESYPYGLCAAYAYNSVGEATNLQYKKSSNCAEAEPGIYYQDASSPSIRGEVLRQESTLANDIYSYDPSGRLTETQETPAGEGCTVRAYSYDEEANRATSTIRPPGTGGACQAEGGTTESHNYDEANRLIDPGIAYDAYGNVTKLPAADAEGHELSSTYYVDNAVATQTQSGVTNEFKLDPEGRTRELISGATKTTNHYDAPGEAISWSESPEKWVRNIAGVDGSLLATQTNGETPVLQLHDLQGDVVATIGDKAGETKLLSTYNSTEFGVPNGKAPPKFAFLGAFGTESSLPSGVITYGSTSYVPQTGRPLQSEAVAPPGLPGGSGAGAPYTMQEEAWNMQGAAREAAEAPGLEAAREQAALEAAFNAAQDIDPHELFTLADARIKGEQFLKIATAAEIIDVIGSIPESIADKVAGLIFDKFSVDIGLDWYHKAGQKLVECSYLYKKGFRRCDFGYTNTEFSIFGFSVSFVDLGDAPEVEKCAPPLIHLPGNPWIWRCERLGENYLQT